MSDAYWHKARMAHRRLIMGSANPEADNETIEAALIRGSEAEDIVSLAGLMMARAFIGGPDLEQAIIDLKDAVGRFQDAGQEGNENA